MAYSDSISFLEDFNPSFRAAVSTAMPPAATTSLMLASEASSPQSTLDAKSWMSSLRPTTREVQETVSCMSHGVR